MKAPVMIAAAAVIVAMLGAKPAPATDGALPQQFDHAKHRPFVADCATCHAGVRGTGSLFPDPAFCATCHNGSMQPEVAWRPPEPSGAGLKFRHEIHPPFECAQCHGTSDAPDVIVRAQAETCFACHGIEGEHGDASAMDCAVCHAQLPAPASHGFEWREGHAVPAAAAPDQCANCHVRSDCLDCHRPGAASPAGGYHPADFLMRHPSSAYNRETSCADCHNVAQFCQTCHLQAGLTAKGGGIGAGYHDAQPNFASGHGQAARQSLETCVSCHVERDCLRCHNRMNPHGPGFNAETLREKNAQMCTACHGVNVPDPD
jgi:predicted CXXCH cytochrome family protein